MRGDGSSYFRNRSFKLEDENTEIESHFGEEGTKALPPNGGSLKNIFPNTIPLTDGVFDIDLR